MIQNTRATQAGSYQEWDDSLQATLMEGVTISALDSVARPRPRLPHSHVLNEERPALAEAVSEALGSEFDVVLESTHLRVEWIRVKSFEIEATA